MEKKLGKKSTQKQEGKRLHWHWKMITTILIQKKFHLLKSLQEYFCKTLGDAVVP